MSYDINKKCSAPLKRRSQCPKYSFWLQKLRRRHGRQTRADADPADSTVLWFVRRDIHGPGETLHYRTEDFRKALLAISCFSRNSTDQSLSQFWYTRINSLTIFLGSQILSGSLGQMQIQRRNVRLLRVLFSSVYGTWILLCFQQSIYRHRNRWVSYCYS